MQLRRHSDIIAIKNGAKAPVAFHARNIEVASISEEAWNSMAPTTFTNGFEVKLQTDELKENQEAYGELETWQNDISEDAHTPPSPGVITSLTLNVTQLCNLHCTYCAAGGDGTYGDPIARISIEKTLPQIDFFLKKLSESQTFHLTFLGGEPLLYPEAVHAIATHVSTAANTLGVNTRFTVITNATLITEKVVDLLAAIKANITVSIDGPPETQNLTRPQKNGQSSSEAALAGLRLLLARKQDLGRILLHAVFSKLNLDVKKSYLFFRAFPVDAFEFTFDVTEADTTANNAFMAGMTEVAELAFELGGEKELRRISLFDSYFEALDDQRRTENYCGSGKSLLSLDSKNRIYSCPLDVGQKALVVGEHQTVDVEKLKDLQSPFIEKNNCQQCWARYLCGGGCLFVHKSLTGEKHKKHTSFCERTRYLIALALLYYEQSRA